MLVIKLDMPGERVQMAMLRVLSTRVMASSAALRWPTHMMAMGGGSAMSKTRVLDLAVAVPWPTLVLVMQDLLVISKTHAMAMSVAF